MAHIKFLRDSVQFIVAKNKMKFKFPTIFKPSETEKMSHNQETDDLGSKQQLNV